MNTYELSAVWDHWKIVHGELRAKDEKDAKAKFRKAHHKKFGGRLTSIKARSIQ